MWVKNLEYKIEDYFKYKYFLYLLILTPNIAYILYMYILFILYIHTQNFVYFNPEAFIELTFIFITLFRLKVGHVTSLPCGLIIRHGLICTMSSNLEYPKESGKKKRGSLKDRNNIKIICNQTA